MTLMQAIDMVQDKVYTLNEYSKEFVEKVMNEFDLSDYNDAEMIAFHDLVKSMAITQINGYFFGSQKNLTKFDGTFFPE